MEKRLGILKQIYRGFSLFAIALSVPVNDWIFGVFYRIAKRLVTAVH